MICRRSIEWQPKQRKERIDKVAFAVDKAAVSIVAKHGWDALHGGENAGDW